MEPQVTDYLSCTDYLRDYYLFRKGKNKNFSYESWSREIGYSHRSNLRLAVKGERGLSTQLEKCIEQKIIKTVHQVRYFRLLCEIQRTKNLDKKSALQKKAMALQKYRTKTVGSDQDDYTILESLYLKVLLGFKDIDRSARGLAKALKEDEAKVLQALKTLQQRGLVEEQNTSKGATHWATDAQYTIFKDDHTNEMLAKFHRQSFLKAIAAQRLPKSTRRFDALVLPLSPKDYANMAKEFETFLDHLFYKYNVDELKGKSLYQIQIGTFPAI